MYFEGDEELNIDELLVPNYRGASNNMFEKYTVSCNNLPKYEMATPLVKF